MLHPGYICLTRVSAVINNFLHCCDVINTGLRVLTLYKIILRVLAYFLPRGLFLFGNKNVEFLIFVRGTVFLSVVLRVLKKIRLVALRFGLLSDRNVLKCNVTAAVHVAR